MKMYYVTRYEHDQSRETEYYIGGGLFAPAQILHDPSNTRLNVRMYQNEALAKFMAERFSATDWHEAEIRV